MIIYRGRQLARHEGQKLFIPVAWFKEENIVSLWVMACCEPLGLHLQRIPGLLSFGIGVAIGQNPLLMQTSKVMETWCQEGLRLPTY